MNGTGSARRSAACRRRRADWDQDRPLAISRQTIEARAAAHYQRRVGCTWAAAVWGQGAAPAP
jgi:hypothetical protein